jgi:hypothetical protein
MQAILIDGAQQSIELIDATQDDLPGLIGFDTVIDDDIGEGHRVFFDEDCFIRGTPGRFRIDALAPIAGRAVILAVDAGGTPAACQLSVDAVTTRVAFQ